MSKAQVFGEGEGIANRTKSLARDNRGHLLNMVAIDGRCTNARSTRKQVISGHGQARHVNNRVGASHARAGQKNRDINVFHRMVGAIGGLVPHRIAVDADRVAGLVVENFSRVHRGVCGIVDQVARPLNMGDFPQERGRVLQVVETRPHVGDLCGGGGKSIDNCLLETCKHLTDGLVHAINASD